MAVYPNFPSAYQYDLARDGTWVFHVDGNGVMATLTAGECDGLAAWSTIQRGPTNYSAPNNRIVALFPNPRQISGAVYTFWRSNTSGYHTPVMQYSLDTTNGMNGTWTTVYTYSLNVNSPVAAAQQRSLVQPMSVSGARALRIAATGGTGNEWYNQTFIIWGSTQPVGLVFWHPSSDIPLLNSDNNLDRGDIYSNTAPVVQQVRVKNTGSQTANNVVVSTDTSNTQSALDTDTTFSLDGTNFAATQTIASIAAGAISAIIHVKRGTPTDAAGTTRNAAMRAVATTWT